MRTSSLPRRRVIRAHVSRVAKTCRNLYKVKHKLEYPHHIVYPYITLGVMTQQKVCTTYPEISQNPSEAVQYKFIPTARRADFVSGMFTTISDGDPRSHTCYGLCTIQTVPAPRLVA